MGEESSPHDQGRPEPALTPPRRGHGTWLEPIALAILALTINLAGNARTGLWDRDEPRYAVAVREMRARGDWLFPTFNGEPRYHKPILIYWLMGLTTSVGGRQSLRRAPGLGDRRSGGGARRLVAGPPLARLAGGNSGRAHLRDGAHRGRRIQAGDDRRHPGALAAGMPGLPLGALEAHRAGRPPRCSGSSSTSPS